MVIAMRNSRNVSCPCKIIKHCLLRGRSWPHVAMSILVLLVKNVRFRASSSGTMCLLLLSSGLDTGVSVGNPCKILFVTCASMKDGTLTLAGVDNV